MYSITFQCFNSRNGHALMVKANFRQLLILDPNTNVTSVARALSGKNTNFSPPPSTYLRLSVRHELDPHRLRHSLVRGPQLVDDEGPAVGAERLVVDHHVHGGHLLSADRVDTSDWAAAVTRTVGGYSERTRRQGQGSRLRATAAVFRARAAGNGRVARSARPSISVRMEGISGEAWR